MANGHGRTLCAPTRHFFDSLSAVPEKGTALLFVEKACYRKICRDGAISALRAAAMRRLRSETRLRAQ